jgi:hypothetical protein
MPTTPLPPGSPYRSHTRGRAIKTDLHVSEIGQGEPIVFIHGSFDPAEETVREQKELADQYRVVLADRRGYREIPAADRLDFDAQVEDILALSVGVLIWWALVRRPAVSAGRGRAPASGMDVNRHRAHGHVDRPRKRGRGEVRRAPCATVRPGCRDVS